MSAQDIREKTLTFLEQFVSVDVEDDEDLFASGLVNSLFAMQLVLFVEKEFLISNDPQHSPERPAEPEACTARHR